MIPREARCLCLSLAFGGLQAQSTHAVQAPDSAVERRIVTFEGDIRPLGPDSLSGPSSLAQRMAFYDIPGVSVAVVRGDEISWTRTYGVKQAGTSDSVNAGTAFLAGSMTTTVTAVAVLRLVDQGHIDLDADVNRYLRRWSLPGNDLTAREPVTVRRILSHTAGLTSGGFEQYQPGEDTPDLLQILDGRTPAKNGPIRVEALPGSTADRSVGGFVILQLVVEDVTGLDFRTAVERLVFAPLGMTRSTFGEPRSTLGENIAKSHGADGAPVALPRGFESRPELGGAGLWTTPTDVARLLIAVSAAVRGESGAFLSRRLAREMVTPVQPGQYGLGTMLGQGNLPPFTGLELEEWGGSNQRCLYAAIPSEGFGMTVCSNGPRGIALNFEILTAVARAEGRP